MTTNNFLLDKHNPAKAKTLTKLADMLDTLTAAQVAKAQRTAEAFLKEGQPDAVAAACERILDYRRPDASVVLVSDGERSQWLADRGFLAEYLAGNWTLMDNRGPAGLLYSPPDGPTAIAPCASTCDPCGATVARRR